MALTLRSVLPIAAPLFDKYGKNTVAGQIKKAVAPASPKATKSLPVITLTPDQVRAQYGTGNYGMSDVGTAGKPSTTGVYGSQAALPGYAMPAFNYSPITVDPKVFKTKAEQQAEITRQAAIQERQAAQQRNQVLGQAVLQGYDQQIANNRAFADTYGDAQRAQLARDRDQQLAASDQSAVQRGLGNTTVRDNLKRGVYSNYNQSRTNLESDLAAQNLGRENALAQARLGYLQSIQDTPMSFGDVASYSAQPGQIAAANAQMSAAQQAAQKAQKNQLLASGLGLLGTVGGAFLGGPGGAAVGGALGSAIGGKVAPAPTAPAFNPYPAGQSGGNVLGYTPFNPYG